ncbi:unnamed protein product, partial [Mesorhabditis spiculigera]
METEGRSTSECRIEDMGDGRIQARLEMKKRDLDSKIEALIRSHVNVSGRELTLDMYINMHECSAQRTGRGEKEIHKLHWDPTSLEYIDAYRARTQMPVLKKKAKKPRQPAV